MLCNFCNMFVKWFVGFVGYEKEFNDVEGERDLLKIKFGKLD